MKRYGEGISKFDYEKLEKFVTQVNGLDWRLTRHGVERLKERAFNMVQIAEAIKTAKLDKSNCFEYYLNSFDNIEKAGFVIAYEGKFIKVFIDSFKRVLSVWINETRDKKLNANFYEKGEN